MQVDVPDPYLNAAWKIGATNMLRDGVKDARGKWRFRDLPYDALAHETHQFLRVLDLMGLHREARDGYEMWLDRVGQPVTTAGRFVDGRSGRVLLGRRVGHAHGGGISVIHSTCCEHYRPHGRPRSGWPKTPPNSTPTPTGSSNSGRISGRTSPATRRLWTNGLLPPHNIWDSRVGDRGTSRTLRTAMPCTARGGHRGGRSRRRAAVRPRGRGIPQGLAGRRGEVADAFAGDPGAGRDVPLVPAAVSLPARPGQPVHAREFEFGVHAHAGAVPRRHPRRPATCEFGLLPANDPRVQGYLDVLEDRLLSENFKIPMRFPDYDPRKDWFSRSGWYYQCGLERTANLHLRLDDPACFLRTWLNQYAVDINPGRVDVPRAHGRPRRAWTSPSRRPPSWNASASCW